MRLLVLLALAGCTRSTPSQPKVAFLLSTLQEERYQKDRRFFEDKAKALGLDVFTLAADNDNARQLGQVEDALSRGAKVLVVQPTDSAAAAAYVDKAHAAGAKLVAYDRAIGQNGSGAPDFYVAHDSHAVGVMQAEEAIKATGGKGNFVLLDGQSGHSVATEIARGYHERLDAQKGITVIVEKSHDAWSPEQALKTVEDALAKSKGEIAAILAEERAETPGPTTL